MPALRRRQGRFQAGGRIRSAGKGRKPEQDRKQMNRFLALGMAALPMLSCSKAQDATPNIIFILADDLGYGDLGCYGQERFCTPEIDSLAAQGMMFTRHYAGAPVSAPSRSSLITGLHTGHTPIRGNKECPVEGQHPIPGDT